MGKRRELPARDVCGQGADLAVDNAERLIRCAMTLKDIQEYGVAQSLLVLAAEELTKVMVLSLYAKGAEIPRDILESLLYWHSSRHDAIYNVRFHFELAWEVRNTMISNPALAYVDAHAAAVARLTEPSSPMGNEANLWSRVEARKERGLYVDFDGGKWLTPADVQEIELDDLTRAVIDYSSDLTTLLEAIQQGPDRDLIHGLAKLLIAAVERTKRPKSS